MLQAALVDGLAFDPLAFGQDGLPAAEVDIGGRQVAEALVVAGMVVVLDEGGDLPASLSPEVAMELPPNTFKRALREGRHQLGLWCSLPGAYAAEAVAGSGFDWLLFDTEHSPGDPLTVLAQLQAVAPYPVSAGVRPASNDAVLIKRLLDFGAQTLLIPYVQNAEEAKAASRRFAIRRPASAECPG
jgi:hypothetical protein